MTLTSDNGYQFISEQFKRFFTGKRHRSTHSSTGMQIGLWTPLRKFARKLQRY